MKNLLRKVILSIPFAESLIIKPLRNYRLRNYYLSLLPLNELDEKSKQMWLERIRLVKLSSDNAQIAAIETAGTLVNGRLVMHNGLQIDPLSYYGAPVMRMLMENRAIHEPQEEYVFQEVLKFIPQGAVMVELGCYWGFYSMWFASKIKNATNVLIDNSDGIARAQSNFKMNNLNGNFKVGYIGKSVPGSDMLYTNVDDISAEFGIQFIDILHSDIQGYELEMLQTMPQKLKNMAIGFVFISTHSNDLHYSCIQFLEDAGFIILCHADLNDSYSEDGLIVARNPKYPGPDKIQISLRTAAGH